MGGTLKQKKKMMVVLLRGRKAEYESLNAEGTSSESARPSAARTGTRKGWARLLFMCSLSVCFGHLRMNPLTSPH